MKKKNIALGALLAIGSTLLSMDMDPLKPTPLTDEKRQELMQNWGSELVTRFEKDDETIVQAQDAIDKLKNFDLDGATPRISEFSDGVATIEYNLSHDSIPEKILVMVIAPKTSTDRLSDKIPLTDQEHKHIPQIITTPPNSLASTPPSSTRKTNIIPSKKSWLENQSTMSILVGVGMGIAAVAALIYFLKNSINGIRIS